MLLTFWVLRKLLVVDVNGVDLSSIAHFFFLGGGLLHFVCRIRHSHSYNNRNLHLCSTIPRYMKMVQRVESMQHTVKTTYDIEQ